MLHRAITVCYDLTQFPCRWNWNVKREAVQKKEEHFKCCPASFSAWIFKIKIPLFITVIRTLIPRLHTKYSFDSISDGMIRKIPDSMTAEQVHNELTKKAHQQYKDIAIVCIYFSRHNLFLHRIENRNISEFRLEYLLWFRIWKRPFFITFTTTVLPCALLTGFQDHG